MTAKRTVSYWKLWLSEEATKIDLHDHRSKILRAVPSINAPPTIPTKAVIQQHLRKAQSRLKSVVQEAANLRARLFEELVEHYNLTSEKGAKATLLLKLQKKEQEKDTFSRLRRIMRKNQSGGLSHVLLPIKGDENNCEKIFDQEKIVKILIEHTRQHYEQAQGTPFTIPPLTELLGKYGTS